MVRSQEKAAHLSDDFVTCRTITHKFEPYTVQVMKHQGTKVRTYYVTLHCERCNAHKSFTVSEAGVVIRRHGYIYPEGYLVKGGLTPEQKREVTLSFIELFSR